MKGAHFSVGVVAAIAACLLVPLAGSAAEPPDVVCPQDTFLFTGTARDLIVPENGFCEVTGATITHNVIQRDFAGAEISETSVGNDIVFADFAGADISKTTIGHDIVAAGTDSGAGITDSSIGHDFVGQGEESGADILRTTIGNDMQLLGLGGGTHLESVTIGHDLFASKPHGLCNLSVGRDLRITDRTINLGISVGGHCVANGQSADTIGRDLVVTGNHAVSGVFGPSSINVSENHVGRDLVFSNNTAIPGGDLGVSGNVVGRDATCAANNPAVTVNAPNVAARSNTCG
jgi:hypothetical protein